MRPTVLLRPRHLVRWLFLWILLVIAAFPVTRARAEMPPSTCTNCHINGWWSALVDWGDVAIHMALLKDATVAPGSLQSQSQVIWWQHGGPSTATHVWKLSNPYDPVPPASGLYNRYAGVDLFCAGHSTLADGTLLTPGGADTGGSGNGEKGVSRYDPASMTWQTPSPPSMQAARFYPTSTTLADGTALNCAGQEYQQFITFGGTDAANVAHGDLDQTLAVLYQPKVTAEISGLAPGCTATPPARVDNSLCDDPVSYDPVTQETPCVLYGGRSSTDASATVFGDVWRLTRDDCNRAWCWEQLQPLPDPATGQSPAPRYGHAAVILQTPADHVDVMLVFGGKNAAGQVLNDLWELRLYQGSQPHWRKITPALGVIPSPRAWISLAFNKTSQELCMFGGADAAGSPRSDLCYLIKPYDNNPAWSAFTGSPTPSPRSGQSMFLAQYQDIGGIDHQMLLVLGGQDATGFQRDVWEYHLDDGTSGAWINLGSRTDGDPTTGAFPAGRSRFASAIDLSYDRLLVYGGQTSASAQDGEIWTYGPVSAIESNANPQPRMHWQKQGTEVSRAGLGAALHNKELFADRPELFTPVTGTGSWAMYPTTACKRQPLYPLMFLLPNGKLFDAGPSFISQTLTGQTWDAAPTYTSVTEGGSAAMYRPGMIFKCGAVADDQSAPGDARGEFLDMTSATPQWLLAANSMSRPRSEPNATILPTGDVLVSGGVTVWGSMTASEFVTEPQIWSPASNSFSAPLAPDPAPRDYHSAALLLPDGRVLTGGGNNNKPPVFQTEFNVRASVYWPPYLFDSNDHLAARPAIQSLPSSIAWGQVFQMCVTNPAQIQRVALIRPGAVTHAFDENQRYVPLAFSPCTAAGGTLLTCTAPVDGNTAPPGDYLVFIVNSSGVPSIARWVRLGSTGAPDPSCVCSSNGCPVADVLRDGAWQMENTVLGRSATGELALDALGVGDASAPEDSTLTLRLRENENEFTTLDHVELQGVSHDSTAAVFAIRGTLVLGRTWPASQVTLRDGSDVTSLFQTGGGFTGRAGDTLYVSFASDMQGNAPATATVHGDGSTPGHVVTAGAGSGGTFNGGGKPNPEGDNAPSRGNEGGGPVTDSAILTQTGILIQVPDDAGGWREVAHWYPREYLADFSLDSLGTQARLVFLAQHTLASLARLEVTDPHPPLSIVPLSTAADARRGDALPALEAFDDGLTMQLARGDTVTCTFALPAAEPGMMRDWFVVTHGIYTSSRQPVMSALPRRAGVPPVPLALPQTFVAYPNLPNPFGGATRIDFDLPDARHVRIDVFDVKGRWVRTLADVQHAAGHGSVSWDRRDARGGLVHRGVYVYRIVAGDDHAVRRMTVL